MTDRRLQDIDENTLENTIRDLPGREPGPNVRARVLSYARPRTRRRWAALRPTVAAALVAALLLLDIFVLKVQDGSLPGTSAGEVIAVSSGRTDDADAVWVAQMLGEAAPARIAWLQADPAADANSYLALRASLLANGTGG